MKTILSCCFRHIFTLERRYFLGINTTAVLAKSRVRSLPCGAEEKPALLRMTEGAT
jgi:hypothetical protein